MPRMSAELLSRCTGKTRRKREETPEQLLRRLTHLYCAEKGIETIEGLGPCLNLAVLYLYDNGIRCIAGLQPCPALTHLYLQNNLISAIENLTHLRRLTKLYLSGNAVTVVEGLEGLSSLTELHVAHQRLPDGEKLLFDPRSLEAIAPSLTVLNVSGNCLTSVEELRCLTALTHFAASDNRLANMKELSRVFAGWPRLWRADLGGNPLELKYKYRDRVITMCHRLGVLDGREVGETERLFLLSWRAVRRARRKQRRHHAPAAIPPSLPIPASLHPSSLSLPALPPRQPRHDVRRRGEGPGGRGREDGGRGLRLPELVPAPEETSRPALHPALGPVKEGAWQTLATGRPAL